MLELATASVRHDNEFSRINTTLERLEHIAEQQQTAIAQHDRTLSRIEAQQELNTQAIAHLTANLLELRTLVANYIQGRSQG
jgi:predicted S18 family serine protease